MVGLLPLTPHHDSLQYIHHVHLMQRRQNQGVTCGPTHNSQDRSYNLTQKLKNEIVQKWLESVNAFIN